MIPIIYEQNEIAFVSNGLGRLRDMIECVVTEERNGIYEVDFSYPVDGLNFDLIQPGRIIACTHDDRGDIQPFDIVSYTKPIDGVVSFHGVHISYRQSQIVASGKNINSLSDAFTMLSGGSPSNPFTYETDKTSTAYLASADGEPRTVRQFLGGVEGSILDTYGGEYEWDKFRVILHSARGADRDLVIRYGVNMEDFSDESDYSETYTAVVPFWRGDDGKGNEVVVKGSLVTSGVTSYNGRELCVPMDLSDKFETKPSAAQLQSLAAATMSSGQSYLPQRSISVKFVDLSTQDEYADVAPLMACRLCDTISVVFPRYNMSGKFKIVKVVYDVLLNRYEEMELGTLSTSLAEALGVSSGISPSYEISVQDLSPTYTYTSGTPATGVTVSGRRWGQVVELYLRFSRYSASAGTDMAVGSLSGIPAPLNEHVRGIGYNGSTMAVFDLIPSCACSVRVNAAVTTSSTSYFHFQVVYITDQ